MMSHLLSRNILIPIWFAAFALFTVMTPSMPLWPSVFMLIVGLVVPVIAYAFFQEAPVRVRLVADTAVPKRDTRSDVLSRLS